MDSYALVLPSPPVDHPGPALGELWSVSCLACGLDHEVAGAPDAAAIAASARWWRCPTCGGNDAHFIRTLVPTPILVGST